MRRSPRAVPRFPQASRLLGALLLLAGLMLWRVLPPGMACASEAARSLIGEAKATFLQTWSERLQAMHSLHMVFTQEKTLRLLRRPLRAQGELWLRGETLRYVLKNAAGETELNIRLDPQTVQTYYPLLQTLEVIDLHTSQAPPLSVPFLVRDPAMLDKAYETALFATSDVHTLRLVPREPQAPVTEMRLSLKDFQPQQFVQLEKNGTRLTLQIVTFTVNPDISDAQLELHVPAGTQVTRPLP